MRLAPASRALMRTSRTHWYAPLSRYVRSIRCWVPAVCIGRNWGWRPLLIDIALLLSKLGLEVGLGPLGPSQFVADATGCSAVFRPVYGYAARRIPSMLKSSSLIG